MFATHGYAGGTTNRIAEHAGLSVGSLYQYFPNKDAILVELVRSHIETGSRVVLAALAVDRTPTSPLAFDAVVRRVITALVQVHGHDRQVHQVLFEQSPRPPSLLAELRALEDAVIDLVAVRLREVYPDTPDVDLTARIIVTTIESLIHRLVANDRPLDIERFIDETTRLVTGYLVGHAHVETVAS